MIVILDTGVLGFATNPSQSNTEAFQCQQWLKKLLRSRVLVIVPEIAYYESRRKHIHLKNLEACRRLEDFVNSPGIAYAPIIPNPF